MLYVIYARTSSRAKWAVHGYSNLPERAKILARKYQGDARASFGNRYANSFEFRICLIPTNDPMAVPGYDNSIWNFEIAQYDTLDFEDVTQAV